MKIVKFKNGKYAIRRWHFGWEFLDLNQNFWWMPIYAYKYCYGNAKEILKRFNEYNEPGTPVCLKCLINNQKEK